MHSQTDVPVMMMTSNEVDRSAAPLPVLSPTASAPFASRDWL
jgi:hypothetical protein